MRRALIAFGPLLVWAAAVLLVGGVDFGIDRSLPTGSDKAAHFVLYGIGGVLAAWAGRWRGSRAGWAGLALVLVTGATDELHQATLPARHGDIWDWAADAAGGTVAFLLAGAVLGRDGAG